MADTITKPILDEIVPGAPPPKDEPSEFDLPSEAVQEVRPQPEVVPPGEPSPKNSKEVETQAEPETQEEAVAEGPKKSPHHDLVAKMASQLDQLMIVVEALPDLVLRMQNFDERLDRLEEIGEKTSAIRDPLYENMKKNDERLTIALKQFAENLKGLHSKDEKKNGQQAQSKEPNDKK